MLADPAIWVPATMSEDYGNLNYAGGWLDEDVWLRTGLLLFPMSLGKHCHPCYRSCYDDPWHALGCRQMGHSAGLDLHAGVLNRSR
jgi:hypothetical protein